MRRSRGAGRCSQAAAAPRGCPPRRRPRAGRESGGAGCGSAEFRSCSGRGGRPPCRSQRDSHPSGSWWLRSTTNELGSEVLLKKPTDFCNRLGESAAKDRRIARKCRQQARWRRRLENHEAALVAFAADEPAEGLLQSQARELVVVVAAEAGSPRLVQDGRLRPRHFVEHGEPERATGHVDAV